MYGAVFAAFVVGVGLILLIAQVRGERGVGPEQPIGFSHPIHVGELGLDCTDCHQTVEVSRHPGFPPLEFCMDCHEDAATDRPEVQKLIRHWEEQEPVEWVEVYELPWHVYFTHKRHIKADVDCAECHGDVSVQMPIRQVRALRMGWCVNCHRERGASTDCWTCHK